MTRPQHATNPGGRLVDMRTTLLLALLACAFACSRSGPGSDDRASAQPDIETSNATATPAATPTEGKRPTSAMTGTRASFSVRVVGQGSPMLLIPGLACSDDVWREAVKRYQERHELHLVTLAGFAGQPAIEPPFLATVEADLVAYVRGLAPRRPVVMGHSLGAHLAFAIASAAPESVGPVIALDGMPFGAALRDPDVEVASLRPRAALLRMQASNVTPDKAEEQARALYAPMVTRAADLQRLVAGAVRSEPAAVGQAMYELMTSDLRARVSAIRTPVLLVVAGEYFEDEEQADTSMYERQLASIAEHQVVVAKGTRHFVMLDDPEQVYGAVDRFLTAASVKR